MSGSGLSRRDFMQIVGLGGASIALTGCGNTSIESGVELVESYVQPENFVVPGVGVYYASTCTQCASACGIMGRVREGRILKLEGNPLAATSGGKICGLGQAAVQQHYRSCCARSSRPAAPAITSLTMRCRPASRPRSTARCSASMTPSP